jgi:hypothetical protein
MAFTRFKYDNCRTVKSQQQATDPGRWILNVPGNGTNPCYMEDPHIRIQKWGANLRTNTINLESDLLGMNRHISRDCLGKDDYKNHTDDNNPKVHSEAIAYPKCNELFTEESRSVAPAWMVRDLEQVDWYYPPLNPQENTCFPFDNNINTRLIEKDNFTPKRDCVINETNNYLPTSFNLIKGTNTCASTDSCQYLPNNPNNDNRTYNSNSKAIIK